MRICASSAMRSAIDSSSPAATAVFELSDGRVDNTRGGFRAGPLAANKIPAATSSRSSPACTLRRLRRRRRPSQRLPRLPRHRLLRPRSPRPRLRPHLRPQRRAIRS